MGWRGRKSMILPLKKQINWFKRIDEGTFQKSMWEYPKELHKNITNCHFQQTENWKGGKGSTKYYEKTTYVVHMKNQNPKSSIKAWFEIGKNTSDYQI